MSFEPYGLLHLAVFGVSALAWHRTVVATKRARGTPGVRRLRRRLGWTILLISGGWTLTRFLPGTFDARESLPLHLCNLAWMIAAWSCFSDGGPERLRHQLVFYWGLGFSSMGYLTPTLTEGPAQPKFWEFWATHWLIIAVGLVYYHGLRWRPTRRGLVGAMAVSTAVYALATGVNLLLDSNYCYSGRTLPEHPTPLDWMGGWPLRILWLWLIAMAWHVVISLKARRA